MEDHLRFVVVGQYVHVWLSQLYVTSLFLLRLLVGLLVAIWIALATEVFKRRVADAKVAQNLVGLNRIELVLPFRFAIR